MLGMIVYTVIFKFEKVSCVLRSKVVFGNLTNKLPEVFPSYQKEEQTSSLPCSFNFCVCKMELKALLSLPASSSLFGKGSS